MADRMTQPSDASVAAFLDTVEPARRRVGPRPHEPDVSIQPGREGPVGVVTGPQFGAVW